MSIKNLYEFVRVHPLAKRNQLATLKRIFIWQIKAKLKGGMFNHKFVNDTLLLVKKGMVGATGNIYGGLHEFYDMSFLLHFLRAEDLFIDVGANIGSYTILASGVIKSKTIAFEPNNQTAEVLWQNVLANEIQNLVQLNKIIVSDKKEWLRFSKKFDAVNHVLVDSEDLDAEKIESTPLDEVVILKTNTLIKVDVEGFETNVLNGASNLLSNFFLKAIIIELNGSGSRYGYDEQKVHDKLIENGFQPYIYEPFSRQLTLVKSFGTHNTIYIRDIDFVMQRVKSANSFSVLNYKI